MCDTTMTHFSPLLVISASNIFMKRSDFPNNRFCIAVGLVLTASLLFFRNLHTYTSIFVAAQIQKTKIRNMTTSTLPLQFPDETWFEDVFGFHERTHKEYEMTRERFQLMQSQSSDPSTKLRWIGDDGKPSSQPPIEITFGSFLTPSVQDLRLECKHLQEQLQKNKFKTPQEEASKQCLRQGKTKILWRNVEGSVLDLHADPQNTGAIFQAASQFNCLEFPQPLSLPENGITNYAWDHTQGPACAIACGAGTAFRNYLVPMPNGTVGQSAKHQINTLQAVLERLTVLNNDKPIRVKVKDGYANSINKHLYAVHDLLAEHSDDLRSLLRVGIQRDTEVTYPVLTGRTVTQVYCSAVPISYSQASADAWKPLAQIILQGAYEATLLEGVRQHLILLQQQQESSDKLSSPVSLPPPPPPTKIYLTLVGGGVFGNDLSWIWQAMEYAHKAVASYPVVLDVAIVHYSGIPEGAQVLVKELNAQSHQQQQ